MKIEFKCPKCGTTPDGCSKKTRDKCLGKGSGPCLGFICECEEDGPDHGTSFTDVCCQANCYHCGHGCSFPTKPKKLQAWEKKALEAGWTPPEARAKELFPENPLQKLPSKTKGV
jgi:hypothetical protein